MRHRLRALVTVAGIAVIVLFALLALGEHQARAHTPRPAACTAAWEAAPPGEKWQAKQRCLQYIERHRLAHLCAKPRPVLAYATVKYTRATRSQRVVLSRVLAEGRRTRAHPNVMVSIVAAVTQESTATNLPYGHGTSVGILQLIDLHGTVAWRMVIENSAGWYYRGARTVRGYRTMPPAQLAQAVQSSAHPTAYQQWVPEARRTYRRWLGPCPR